MQKVISVLFALIGRVNSACPPGWNHLFGLQADCFLIVDGQPKAFLDADEWCQVFAFNNVFWGNNNFRAINLSHTYFPLVMLLLTKKLEVNVYFCTILWF